VGLPRVKEDLGHPKNKNLLFFGSFFENIAGIMISPLYDNKLFAGDYFLNSNLNIKPDFVVLDSKNGDLELIIEVKSGYRKSKRDSLQAEKYFSTNKPTLFITYANINLNFFSKSNYANHSLITEIGFTPFFTDNTMYDLFTDKFNYIDYFSSFSKDELAKKELVVETKKLFNLVNAKNNKIKVSTIKNNFNDILFNLEKKYLN
jgi:hypothetical protein